MNKSNTSSAKSESDLNLRLTSMFTGSVSEQNICLTYVCLINDVRPNLHSPSNQKQLTESLHEDIEEIDDNTSFIQAERSQAVHELVKNIKETNILKERTEETPDSSGNSECSYNPKLLELTKMKWLTEERDGYPNSSCSSITSARSSTCSNVEDSDENSERMPDLGEKYLSTILRLDKEHNLFGLSSIAIVGSKQFRKLRKDDEKPVFHQTAIVQISCAKFPSCTSSCGTCCKSSCCKNKSHSDLPSALKCLGPNCLFCYTPNKHQCFDPAPCPPLRMTPPSKCTPLLTKCGPYPTCDENKCKADHPPCPRPRIILWAKPSNCTSCNKPARACTCADSLLCPSPNVVEPTCCFGLSLRLSRKPKYEPPPIELTPRSSCVMALPLAARPCMHSPPCLPPSSCYPYLMPCYWPSRPNAPCPNPSNCFHVPPCTRPRPKKPCPGLPRETCSKDPPCGSLGGGKKTCKNTSCLGINKAFTTALEENYGTGKKASAGSKA